MPTEHTPARYYTRASTTTITMDDGSVWTLAIASTDVEDRMDDIVDQSWDLAAYKSNPVVMWAHQWGDPPIGKAEWVGKFTAAKAAKLTEKYGLKRELPLGMLGMEIRWDTKQEFGALVARQYSEGFLHAFSVGFQPGKMVRRNTLKEDDPRYREDGYGYVYYDNELLENSAVPIPANPEALAAKGLTIPGALVERGLPVPAWMREYEPPEPIDGAPLDIGASDIRAAVESLLDDPGIAERIRGIALSAPELVTISEPEPPPDDEFWAALGRGLAAEK